MKEVPSKIRNWCARAERSPAQVLRKLAGWDFGPEAEAELKALERRCAEEEAKQEAPLQRERES